MLKPGAARAQGGCGEHEEEAVWHREMGEEGEREEAEQKEEKARWEQNVLN